MPDGIPLFPRRQNRDGSFDSICRLCFATVGNGKTEEELEEVEKKHVCHGTSVYQNGAEKTKRELV
jgi:hypothetical protein